MDMLRLAKEERGVVDAVNVQITLIVSLMVAIIIIYQLFIAGVGPTDNIDAANYDENAINAWNNLTTLAWAGIGLLAIVIIIIAASVILQVVRGFGGNAGKV